MIMLSICTKSLASRAKSPWAVLEVRRTGFSYLWRTCRVCEALFRWRLLAMGGIFMLDLCLGLVAGHTLVRSAFSCSKGSSTHHLFHHITPSLCHYRLIQQQSRIHRWLIQARHKSVPYTNILSCTLRSMTASKPTRPPAIALPPVSHLSTSTSKWTTNKGDGKKIPEKKVGEAEIYTLHVPLSLRM